MSNTKEFPHRQCKGERSSFLFVIDPFLQDLVTEKRMFIREGVLTKICRKVPKKRWFFLFSDIVIYASVVSNSSTQKSQKNVYPIIHLGVKERVACSFFLFLLTFIIYNFHRMLNLSKVRVKSEKDTPQMKNAFQITSSDKSFIVFADTSEEKEFWLMDFNEYTTGSRLIEEEQAEVRAPSCLITQSGRHCLRVVMSWE